MGHRNKKKNANNKKKKNKWRKDITVGRNSPTVPNDSEPNENNTQSDDVIGARAQPIAGAPPRPKLCGVFKAATTYLGNIFSNFTSNEYRIHGRTLVTSLADVPHMWPACLGGSKVTLLVQVCRWSPEHDTRRYKGLTAWDAGGQEVTIQASKGISCLPLAKGGAYPAAHLEPGDFVAIKGAQWSRLGNDQLGLRVESEKDFVAVLKEEYYRVAATTNIDLDLSRSNRSFF